MFAIIGDKGEPIGQPKICLQMTLLITKNDDCKQISNASMIFGTARLVHSPKVQSSPTLLATMVLAVLSGTEVKLTTSNETCDSDLPSLMNEINSTNSEEFLTVYWVFPTKGTRICLRNLASW